MSRNLKSFCLWLIQVVVLSVLLIFFLWLLLHPSSPSFKIVDFSYKNYSVSFLIDFSNDNKGGNVSYNNTKVTLYSADRGLLGDTDIPSFQQEHERSDLILAHINVLNNQKLKGKKNFKIVLRTFVIYKIWWWRSRIHAMNVEGAVYLDDDGKIKGTKNIEMHEAVRK